MGPTKFDSKVVLVCGWLEVAGQAGSEFGFLYETHEAFLNKDSTRCIAVENFASFCEATKVDARFRGLFNSHFGTFVGRFSVQSKETLVLGGLTLDSFTLSTASGDARFDSLVKKGSPF